MKAACVVISPPLTHCDPGGGARSLLGGGEQDGAPPAHPLSPPHNLLLIIHARQLCGTRRRLIVTTTEGRHRVSPPPSVGGVLYVPSMYEGGPTSPLCRCGFMSRRGCFARFTPSGHALEWSDVTLVRNIKCTSSRPLVVLSATATASLTLSQLSGSHFFTFCIVFPKGARLFCTFLRKDTQKKAS